MSETLTIFALSTEAGESYLIITSRDNLRRLVPLAWEISPTSPGVLREHRVSILYHNRYQYYNDQQRTPAFELNFC